ncbi:hypothetical protein G4B88_018137 [Cannabis sativa]|uniref:S-protein homolog n=1 Tax=Cannabis sativa TaxID=3483 RepID=A0A7J6DLV7_CANSA|nr:hypothetical protein G4B88_018137 [Cannabis sativa]
MSINNKVLLVDATVVIDNEREVKVKVMNRLGYGDSMIVHCQSNYHDLPSVVIEDGREMEWIITGSNLLGVPLFHCEMQPKTSTIWYSFDAYDPQRDGGRCRTECRWMIPNNGALYGYDQRFSRWVRGSSKALLGCLYGCMLSEWHTVHAWPSSMLDRVACLHAWPRSILGMLGRAAFGRVACSACLDM